MTTPSTTAEPRRIRHPRRGLVIAGIAAAAVVAVPTAAFAADANNAKTLGYFNDSVCTPQAYANTQLRAEGTATKKGAKFFMYRNGAQIYTTPTPTASGFTAEYRPEFGNFPGPGWYQVCAVNKQTTLTYATVRLRTDSDVPPLF